jgi:hypothetical protein
MTVLRNVYEKQRLKMEVLPPVASVKSQRESTKRIRSGNVNVNATVTEIVSVNVTHTATEAKTTKRSRVARSIITAAAVTMPSMRRVTGIVLRIGITKSEKRTTPQCGRRKNGNIGLPSIMRGTMGGNGKERETENERGESGMMYQGEKAETRASQCGRKGFMMKEQRRCYKFLFFVRSDTDRPSNLRKHDMKVQLAEARSRRGMTLPRRGRYDPSPF